MTSRPKVVVLAALPAAGFELLRPRFRVVAGSPRADSRWLREHAPGVVAIVAAPSIPVGPELMDAVGTSLKVVANFGVGYDNIDVEAARARGVRATNTPGVLTNATAELAVALMLAAGRRITEVAAMVRSDCWSGSEETVLGRELAGATIGLVGTVEATLLCASRSGVPAGSGVRRRELPDLLAASDFVSLHVPLTPETRHLIDAGALAMKRGAILVNTSRGASGRHGR